MSILGSLALLFALALSIYNLVFGAVAQRQTSTGSRGRISPARLAGTARYAGMVGFAAVSAAVFALLWAIFSNDFSLSYVVHESNRALPAAYKFAALWSGQEGSLLLWAWLLTGLSFIVRAAAQQSAARLTAFGINHSCRDRGLLSPPVEFRGAALSLGSPGAVPADGFGMNPLLQYPEMVIHPPLLYLGYVGFSVPFAFALGR